MSANLEKDASSQAGTLYNVKRQIFQSVPPIPSNISLAGKTALITGSNVGLGLECARHFLKLRLNRLIMGVRSLDRGEAAAIELRSEFPEATIDVWQLDMESPRSVQAFAQRCEQELDTLDVAVLNAALGKLKFTRTEEGSQHETTIQVNYLSTALLATLLIPKLKSTSTSSQPSRLTIITSDAALGVKLENPSDGKLLDSFDRAVNYEGYEQYSKSKLLVTMFTQRLAEVISPDEVVINSCNPGATKGTAFLRDVDSWYVKMIFTLLFTVTGRKVVDAARIYVHASLVLGKSSHGSFTDWLIRSWPLTMYSSLGRQISDKLWNETMDELRPFGVDAVLNGSKI